MRCCLCRDHLSSSSLTEIEADECCLLHCSIYIYTSFIKEEYYSSMNPPFTTTATSHQLPLSLTTTSPNNNHSSNSNPHYRTCSRVWLVRGFQFLCLVQWVVLAQWGGPLLSSPLDGGAAARSLTTTTTTITQKAMQEMTTTTADVAVEALPQSEQPQHVAPLPPTTTTTTPRPKRWAIMMMGGARTYAFARESFWKNFLGQTDLEYDIFSYSFLP